MKTLAFAGSNSSTSINQQLISYAAQHISNSEVIELTDYPAPIYSEDLEKASGIDKNIQALAAKIAEADNLIIAVNEHNGYISAFFKNTLDWLSRYNREFLKGKKVIVLSTSPGPGGAKSALTAMTNTLPYFGAEIVASQNIGSFYEVFKEGKIIDASVNDSLKNTLKGF